MLTTLRFSSPRIVSNRLLLNVDAKCSEPGQSIAGINVRYFYDNFYCKTTATAVQLIDFAGGYKLGFARTVTPYPGTASTKDLLNLTGLPVYINCIVELLDKSKAPVILDDWQKLFTISAELKITPGGPIYPSFVWDLEYNPLRGSFFPTSEGLVVVMVKDAGTVKRTDVAVEQFNWDYLGDRAVKPFGMAVPEIDCNI